MGSRREAVGSRRGQSQGVELGGQAGGELGSRWGSRWGRAGGELGGSRKNGIAGEEREESQGGDSESSTAAFASTAAPRCLPAFAAVSPLRLLTVWSVLTVRCPGSPTQLEQS